MCIVPDAKNTLALCVEERRVVLWDSVALKCGNKKCWTESNIVKFKKVLAGFKYKE